MDSLYQKIGELTADYIKLNEEFIAALSSDKPSSEITTLKEQIKNILQEIEELEKLRDEKLREENN
jgi:EAL domain-containing protein (putative c-di-GMP-specific phosphodiesterase class I)